MRYRGPLFERWRERVAPAPLFECWEWLAGKNKGYGSLARGPAGAGLASAHRFAYEHFIGPVPAGLDLDHLCRNRGCCNPLHLEPVTRRENFRRGEHHERRKTHCKAGHAFTPESTRGGKRPRWRLCRALWSASFPRLSGTEEADSHPHPRSGAPLKPCPESAEREGYCQGCKRFARLYRVGPHRYRCGPCSMRQ